MDYIDLVNKIEWNDWEDGSLSVAKVEGRILMASKTGFEIFDAKTLKTENGYMEKESTLEAFKETAVCALVGLLEAAAADPEACIRKQRFARAPCAHRAHMSALEQRFMPRATNGPSKTSTQPIRRRPS